MTKLRAGTFSRWTPRRKRAVVDRLDELTHAGEHQAAEALLVEHNISEEELAMWRTYLAKEGARVGHWALRATRVQDYRSPTEAIMKPCWRDGCPTPIKCYLADHCLRRRLGCQPLVNQRFT